MDHQEVITIGAIITNLDKIIKDRIRIFEEQHYIDILNKIRMDQDMFKKVKALSGALS